jgi:hypothetical protein
MAVMQRMLTSNTSATVLTTMPGTTMVARTPTTPGAAAANVSPIGERPSEKVPSTHDTRPRISVGTSRAATTTPRSVATSYS